MRQLAWSGAPSRCWSTSTRPPTRWSGTWSRSPCRPATSRRATWSPCWPAHPTTTRAPPTCSASSVVTVATRPAAGVLAHCDGRRGRAWCSCTAPWTAPPASGGSSRQLDGFAVVRYDRRGYGRSVELGPPDRHGRTGRRPARRHRRRNRHWWPVHSYGGTLALAAAARHPDRDPGRGGLRGADAVARLVAGDQRGRGRSGSGVRSRRRRRTLHASHGRRRPLDSASHRAPGRRVGPRVPRWWPRWPRPGRPTPAALRPGADRRAGHRRPRHRRRRPPRSIGRGSWPTAPRTAVW